MVSPKGPLLEELVRAYFSRQGFFALRSVPFRFDGEEVTDIDVWLYSRYSASARMRAVVDVKNKRSPKAFERILWVKGIQMALQCDRAFIATTEVSPKVARFSQSQQIQVLSKSFLDRLEKKLDMDDRLTLEEFSECINQYGAHKQDGDWLQVLAQAKSAVLGIGHFPAFNNALVAFRFFGERLEVRLQHREPALRCALLTASLACVSLDSALERLVYEDGQRRFDNLVEGVNFGDNGDGRVKASIFNALSVISDGLPNGRALAAQARKAFDEKIEGLRAEIIAEHFSREHHAQHLFTVARELDTAAHARRLDDKALSVEARSILGVFADFTGVKRTSLPIASASSLHGEEQFKGGVKPSEQETPKELLEAASAVDKQEMQPPLI